MTGPDTPPPDRSRPVGPSAAPTTPPPPVPPPPPPPVPPPPPGDEPPAAAAASSSSSWSAHGGDVAATPVPRPHLDDRERTLDPRVVQVWRLFSALGLVPPLLIGTAIGVAVIGRWGWLIPLGFLLVIGVSVGWYAPARYARWRWRLTDLALELRHGVVVHQQEAVPYFRIQQIDVTQGPVDRLLGLATLQVTTASASGSVALPGIAAADAPGVRAELLARAAEAVGEHPGEVSDAV